VSDRAPEDAAHEDAVPDDAVPGGPALDGAAPDGAAPDGAAADGPAPDDVAPAVVDGEAPATDAGVPWSRLDHRVIWVDLARTLLSASPAVVAVTVFGVQPSPADLWPLLAVAAFGTVGAGADALRWAFTRYRITEDYVERRTGVVVRRYRSVRRDRIRSVDTSARLRHRLAGLRVVLVGAGQQSAAGESALALDAVSRQDAERLRATLLEEDAEHAEQVGQVLARFRLWWVVYNMASTWSFVTAAGLLWGAYWLLEGFGLDPATPVEGFLDRTASGRAGTVALVAALLFGIGAVGMGVSFLLTSWGFELARVPGEHGTQLRTRQGLLTTRTVHRDDRRLRGVTVSEPVAWRWMRMADTQVITTGLSVWSPSQPASVLPRGPRSVAWPVARAVLGADPDPFGAPLVRHPAGALRRRLWWATAVTGVLAAVAAWLAALGVVPAAAVWWAAGCWPVTLLAAVIAYRSLGHAVVGDFLVVRSGLLTRSTSALRRDAVSTIALRESVLQRRLGLRTVAAMTAAGWGAYEAPDVAADEALHLAAAAAPGLLDPFLVPADAPDPPT
jgi:putative membrane protein